ncbi:MAG: type II secretion system protein [Planctomycetota bacterium]
MRVEGSRRMRAVGAGAGFTLIELLVVIAIIALLVAILMPTLNEAKDMARTVACQTNLSQMGRAMHAYATDFGGVLCYDTHLTAWSLGGHGYRLPKTYGHISAYMDGTPVYFNARPSEQRSNHEKNDPDGPAGVMYCPAYETKTDIRGRTPFPGWEGRHATCLQNMGPTHIARSYRVNDWFMKISPDPKHLPSANWCDTVKEVPRMQDLRAASKLITFGEAYNKNLYIGFKTMYFNPHHGDRAPAVRADSSVKLYTDAEARGGSGYPWSPNHGVSSSHLAETWGPYLHPEYSKSY